MKAYRLYFNLFVFALAVLFTLLVIRTFIVAQTIDLPPVPNESVAPLSFDNNMRQEDDLRKNAISYAETYGLVGTPTEERGVLMSLGSFLTLMDSNVSAANLNLERSAPIYVYEVKGNIPSLKMYGLAAGRKDIDTMIFAIDAVSGQIIAQYAFPKTSTSPNLSYIPRDKGEMIGSPVATEVQ